MRNREKYFLEFYSVRLPFTLDQSYKRMFESHSSHSFKLEPSKIHSPSEVILICLQNFLFALSSLQLVLCLFNTYHQYVHQREGWPYLALVPETHFFEQAATARWGERSKARKSRTLAQGNFVLMLSRERFAGGNWALRHLIL